MINPPISLLMSKVDCRYTLVVITAKRARQLIGGAEKMMPSTEKQPVSIAAQEIAQGLVTYRRIQSGER